MTLSKRILEFASVSIYASSIWLFFVYAEALYKDDGATLGDLREAVETLEEAESVARRVLGGAHPLVGGIEAVLQEARAALRARETPSQRGNA